MIKLMFTIIIENQVTLVIKLHEFDKQQLKTRKKCV